MNDVDFPVQKVLDGIDAAADAGLGPVKINMVVKRGVNDTSVIDMAARFKGTGHTLRFIEYMDVGATNGWELGDIVAADALIETVNDTFPIEPVPPSYQARSQTGGGTSTAPERSASSARSRNRSAAAARALAFPPLVPCTPVCLRQAVPTCVKYFERPLTTRCSTAPSTRSGPTGPTATLRPARRSRPAPPKSK